MTKKMEKCKLCGEGMRDFGSLQLLRKYDVQYFECPVCAYVQTEQPYWLEEAYSSALSALDVGAVSRNKQLETITASIIQNFLNPDGQFVDCGGGHGLFVRMMRDRGLDFKWMDKFAENLFARGFEYEPNDKPVELLTAFEVFEHLEHPEKEILEMLELCPNLLFSTMLMPDDRPKPGNWWYYVPESGQHIGLFSLQSLQLLAEKRGLYFYTNGVSLHMFSKKPISALLFKLLCKQKIARVFNCLHRRDSLIQNDLEHLKEAAFS